MKKIIALVVATCMLTLMTCIAFAEEYSAGRLNGSYTDGVNTYYGLLDVLSVPESEQQAVISMLNSDKTLVYATFNHSSAPNRYELKFISMTSGAGCNLTDYTTSIVLKFPTSLKTYSFKCENINPSGPSLWTYGGMNMQVQVALDKTFVSDGVLVSGLIRKPNVPNFPTIPTGTYVTSAHYTGDLVFKDNLLTEDDKAVNSAYNLLNGSKFTYQQSSANTQMDITKALQKSISAIIGFPETGVVVELEDIEITDFTPAVSGSLNTPIGTNGSFIYSVTLRKGSVSKVLSSLTGSIIASEYVPSEDRVSVTIASEILKDNKTFDFKQQDISNQSNLVVSLKQSIQSLQGFSSTGVSVAVNIEEFQSAVDGTADNEIGTNGSYLATAVLSKGIEIETISNISGIIKASPYIPDTEPPIPPNNADLATAMNFMLNNFVYVIAIVLPVACIVFSILLSVPLLPRIIRRFAKGT